MKLTPLIIPGILFLSKAIAQPVINEFLASNDDSIEDGEGNNEDWIELHNPTNAAIDLSGYHLTDDITEPEKFTFPNGASIGPNEFLIVFASGQDDSNFIDSAGFQHTNFSLNTDGEYLAINNPDGTIIDAISPEFPEQFTDISYGRDDSGNLRFFQELTPGETNSATSFAGLTNDTKFSVNRGYFTGPFVLEITTSTPDASIIVTTNGTEPSTTNGFRYSFPIVISETSTVRAIAIGDDFIPTNVDTQSYFFVEDIITQNASSSLPDEWGGEPADYAMDAKIVNDPAYSDQFEESFASLPTLSLVFDPDSFFDEGSGIYQNPTLEGSAWERPLSAELIVPNGTEEGFQIDAGVRIQGGSSRDPDTPKHSLSLRFRRQYGAGKLDYPLFQNEPHGEDAVESFDYLQLRPEYNFGWMHRHWYQCEYALYGRDQWASDLYLAMGNNGTRGRWVHLFLNGLYWGVYDLHERPDADYMVEYFGGDDSDYDTINNLTATNGDLAAYNTMVALADSDIENPATYEAFQEFVDLDSFIDYILLNFYIGNRDWDFNNWRAARRREAGAKFFFFPWDSEFAATHVTGGRFPSPPDFFSTTLQTNIVDSDRPRRPTGIHTQLLLNDEYQILFADRIQKHFFNQGALTPDNSANEFAARSDLITPALVAESARWGDFRRDVNPDPWDTSQYDLYTRDDHYLPTLTWLFDTYLPQRTDIVVADFRAQGTFPSIDSPSISLESGLTPRGSTFTFTSDQPVYFTTDGNDPRLTGGMINPNATLYTAGTDITINESTEIKTRALSDIGEWSALNTANFTVDAGGLVISEILYNPAQAEGSEFIEITNQSAFEISLTGLTFTDGFVFNFDEHSSIESLAPGASLLIVNDLGVFQSVYGNDFDALIAGTFQDDTGLSNGGETITLSDANDITLISLTYNDRLPWPLEADGDGHSLVFAGDDPNLPSNWRISTTLDGNPGSSDSIPLLDGDLLGYALVDSPAITPEPAVVSWTTPIGADSVTFAVEISPDLESWTELTGPFESIENNVSAGTRTFSVAVPTDTKHFARIIVRQR